MLCYLNVVSYQLSCQDSWQQQTADEGSDSFLAPLYQMVVSWKESILHTPAGGSIVVVKPLTPLICQIIPPQYLLQGRKEAFKWYQTHCLLHDQSWRIYVLSAPISLRSKKLWKHVAEMEIKCRNGLKCCWNKLIMFDQAR